MLLLIEPRLNQGIRFLSQLLRHFLKLKYFQTLSIILIIRFQIIKLFQNLV
jgi:hypothetical protein